ncbi:MAG: hypothetical protein ACFB4I_18710 [Cyanophyceae cyanobacterium]
MNINGNELDKDIKSFLSYALAIEPKVSIGGVEFHFNETEKLSDREFASIDELMRKYEKVKRLLPDESSLDSLQITKEKPIVQFEPNTNYQIVTVNAEQLDLTKDIYQRIAQIHQSYTEENHSQARNKFDDLQSFLNEKRRSFLGDFQRISAIDDTVGMHAVGAGGDPQTQVVVIFIIIEIYVEY